MEYNMTTQLKISGMTCDMCVRHVRMALQDLPGVTHVSVDLDKETATVEHDGASTADMLESVHDAGYGAKVAE